MKKGLIVGITFLCILIVFMSFVSAGFFSDLVGKITGKDVEGRIPIERDDGGTETYCYCPSDYECGSYYETGCARVSCGSCATDYKCNYDHECVWNKCEVESTTCDAAPLGFDMRIWEYSNPSRADCSGAISDNNDECATLCAAKSACSGQILSCTGGTSVNYNRGSAIGSNFDWDIIRNKCWINCQCSTSSSLTYLKEVSVAVQTTSKVCGDGTEDNPNDAGVTEECDGVAKCDEDCSCEEGWSEGASGDNTCVEDLPSAGTCVDSDNGYYINIKGKCTNPDGTIIFDTCATEGGTVVHEMICPGSDCVQATRTGCSTGDICEFTAGVGAACVAEGGPVIKSDILNCPACINEDGEDNIWCLDATTPGKRICVDDIYEEDETVCVEESGAIDTVEECPLYGIVDLASEGYVYIQKNGEKIFNSANDACVAAEKECANENIKSYNTIASLWSRIFIDCATTSWNTKYDIAVDCTEPVVEPCVDPDDFDPYQATTMTITGRSTMNDLCWSLDTTGNTLIERLCTSDVDDPLIQRENNLPKIKSDRYGYFHAYVNCPRGCVEDSSGKGDCVGDACGDGVCSPLLSETTSNCAIDCPSGNAWEAYSTCEACVPAYTWCADGAGDCVSGTGGCNIKINSDLNCPTTSGPGTCSGTSTVSCSRSRSSCRNQERTTRACYWTGGAMSSGECKKTSCGTHSNEPACRTVGCTWTEPQTATNCRYKPGTTGSAKDIVNAVELDTTVCTPTFKFNVMDSLPLDMFFNIPNMRIVKILNITTNVPTTTAFLNLTIDEAKLNLRFPVANITVYIGEATGWQHLTQRQVTDKDNTDKEYTYRVRTNHFSLFLITEPDYCNGTTFEPEYFEECDGSSDCTNECVCKSGFNEDGEGNCVEERDGTDCSDEGEGEEDCDGPILYECDDDLEWDKLGVFIGECDVECIAGNNSCSGEFPTVCGIDYEWHPQQKIIGQCGYTGTLLGDDDPIDRCGNGYCNYEEDEYSCPEDCEDDVVDPNEEPNWFLIMIVGLVSLLIIIIVVVLFKIYTREKRRPVNVNRNLPPMHRPGPKRPPGRPQEVNRGQIGRPPARKISPGGYAVRRYPTGKPPQRR